jgi:hypothetical protein
MRTKAAFFLNLIVVLAISGPSRAGLLRPCTPEPATLKEAPASEREVVTWIVQAIQDEVEAWRAYDEKRILDTRSDESLFFNVPDGQEVLIEPFDAARSDVVVHVLYPLPNFGWVLREVAFYPDHRLALFWLGYSANGPGASTGFNCTHALSNCKLQDLDLEVIRRAFSCWWLAHYSPLGPDTKELPREVRLAKQRNAQREAIIRKWQKGE